MQESLGIIETIGLTAAVAAADAAVKAANVTISCCTTIGAGKVNVFIRGDVAAVKASIEAGSACASQVGKVAATTVIPRPADRLAAVFPIGTKKA